MLLDSSVFPSPLFQNLLLQCLRSKNKPPLPPSSIKKNTQIDQLIEKTQQSIDLLKEKRAALITAAVTGKIDVRDYNERNAA